MWFQVRWSCRSCASALVKYGRVTQSWSWEIPRISPGDYVFIFSLGSIMAQYGEIMAECTPSIICCMMLHDACFSWHLVSFAGSCPFSCRISLRFEMLWALPDLCNRRLRSMQSLCRAPHDQSRTKAGLTSSDCELYVIIYIYIYIHDITLRSVPNNIWGHWRVDVRWYPLILSIPFPLLAHFPMEGLQVSQFQWRAWQKMAWFRDLAFALAGTWTFRCLAYLGIHNYSERDFHGFSMISCSYSPFDWRTQV